MFSSPSRIMGLRLRAYLTLILLLTLFATSLAQAATCRVTIAGSPAGSGTWVSPMDLQTALTTSSCNEIWVKAGTYTTGTPSTNTFSIMPGVTVYGGFAGTETLRSERNTATLNTTLSGNTGVQGVRGNFVVTLDGTTAAGIITASTVLDGFNIRDGKTGLLCKGDGIGKECSPSLNFLDIFNNNTSGEGAGVYISSNGGGTSNPALSNVAIRNNISTLNGAGIYNSANGAGSTSNPTLTDVRLEGNNASNGIGGGIYNFAFGAGANSSPTLSRVSIWGNNSGSPSDGGGGLVARGWEGGSSSPVLNDVIFLQNSSAGYGGAMFVNGGNGNSSPLLNNVTFDFNYADIGGGAMFIAAYGVNGVSNPILANTTFVRNVATSFGGSYGGAIYNDALAGATSSPVLRNVTMTANGARSSGGAIYNGPGGGTNQMTLVNVIMWANEAPSGVPSELFNEPGVTTGIQHSVVAGGCPAGAACSNVGANDPKLISFGPNGGSTNNFLLAPGSSAIDSGDDVTCTTAPVNSVDQRGQPRPMGSHCDIGAVEMPDTVFADGFEG